MIQRVQTIFLFLSGVAIILMAFFPIAVFTDAVSAEANTKYMVFTVFEVSNEVGPDPFSLWFNLPLILLVAAVAVISIATIFLYKNRPLQMKMTQTGIFLNIIMVVGILFFYIDQIEKVTGTMAHYDDIGIYLPLISLVFLILANRFIRKDEKRVRSVDRLR
ncbi:MAG: DUF4293 domain-containing protein [Bacteroidales bacterium]|nr:DUF4293 domain-containing protein [Bacteroidales bacterium]MCF8334592.1 DUF4293 domain-containing protein [Bacteroidales bacterium]